MNSRFLSLLILFTTTVSFSQKVHTLAKIEPRFGDGMIIAPNGDLLVSGGYDKTKILKITRSGSVSTFLDNLPGPVGMGFDSKGNLFVANYMGNSIFKITPDMEVSTFAKGLDGPSGLVVNKNDEIFVSLYGANFSGTGGKILKFQQDGTFVDYTKGNGLQDVIGITLDESDNIFVSNFKDGFLFKVNMDGEVVKVASIDDAKINQIVYHDGFVYLPSPNLRIVYRFNVSQGSFQNFAGTGGDKIINGELIDSQFNMPNSCAIDTVKNKLYVLEHKLGVIREIDL